MVNWCLWDATDIVGQFKNATDACMCKWDSVIKISKTKQEKANNMTKTEFNSQTYQFIITDLHTEKKIQKIYSYITTKEYYSQLLPLADFLWNLCNYCTLETLAKV